jgi:hypothetical protein
MLAEPDQFSTTRQENRENKQAVNLSINHLFLGAQYAASPSLTKII